MNIKQEITNEKLNRFAAKVIISDEVIISWSNDKRYFPVINECGVVSFSIKLFDGLEYFTPTTRLDHALILLKEFPELSFSLRREPLVYSDIFISHIGVFSGEGKSPARAITLACKQAKDKETKK